MSPHDPCARLREALPEAPEEFWRELDLAHREPPRVYHNLSHVVTVVEEYRRVAQESGWQEPRAVLLALLCHDAIYEAGRTDNEVRSAAFADALVRRCLPVAIPELPRVRALIEMTARHGSLVGTALDADAARFLDCDMAVLGADPEVYRRYAEGVAAEFAAVVPAAAYREGRRGFLSGLLAAERLFCDLEFHQRLDAKARSNIRAELARL